MHGRINYAYRRQREYLERIALGARYAGILRPRPVAYFSAEFGLHVSIPEYSGGLGVLAGDHIKSASDLGIPLVGIGLFYGQGYFRQRLDQNGWQHEEYMQTDVNQLPMEPAIGTNGEPVTVQIDTRGGPIRAKVWRMKVGAAICCCSIQMSKATRPRIGNLPHAYTGAMDAFESGRSCYWASEASAR